MVVFRDAVGWVWNIGDLNGALSSIDLSCTGCILRTFELAFHCNVTDGCPVIFHLVCYNF